jgi:F0F1-type ATP synthase membrane subunit b/b'
LQRKVRHCDEITEERDKALADLDEARARVIDAALIHADLVRERDEARAEVQDYREQLRKLPDANRVASQDAYRRGAEAMREACANAVERSLLPHDHAAQSLRALPIPEEP